MGEPIKFLQSLISEMPIYGKWDYWKGEEELKEKRVLLKFKIQVLCTDIPLQLEKENKLNKRDRDKVSLCKVHSDDSWQDGRRNRGGGIFEF